MGSEKHAYYGNRKIYRLRKVHLLSVEKPFETLCGLLLSNAEILPFEVTNREEKTTCGNCLKCQMAFNRFGYWPDYGRRKK